MAVANANQGKPIVFIAVNSGNSTNKVASYLRDKGVNWPTIVDSARQFEAAAGVGEISLKNIMGYCVFTPEGTLVRGNGFEGSVRAALKNAQWNIDPETIPAGLQEAWQAIEFGDFVSQSRTLQRALKSKKEDVREAAETLNQFVQDRLTAMLEKATTAQAEGDHWLAYKTFQEFQVRFKGHETETDVRAELKTLAAIEAVENELAAAKQLESALRTASRSGLERVAKRLEKLVENYPNTEAAQKATALLGAG